MESRWEWKFGDTWKPYNTVIDKAMTNAYNGGTQLMEVRINNTSYIIDFKSMRQFVKNDSKRWRRVRQVVQTPRPVKSTTTTIMVDNTPSTQLIPVGTIQADIVYNNGQPFASTTSGLVPVVNLPTPQGTISAIDNGSGAWIKVEPLPRPQMTTSSTVYQNQFPLQTGGGQMMITQPPAMATAHHPQTIITSAVPQMAVEPTHSMPIRIPDSPPDLRYQL